MVRILPPVSWRKMDHSSSFRTFLSFVFDLLCVSHCDLSEHNVVLFSVGALSPPSSSLRDFLPLLSASGFCIRTSPLAPFAVSLYAACCSRLRLLSIAVSFGLGKSSRFRLLSGSYPVIIHCTAFPQKSLAPATINPEIIKILQTNVIWLTHCSGGTYLDKKRFRQNGGHHQGTFAPTWCAKN